MIVAIFVLLALAAWPAAAQLQISDWTRQGGITLTGVFANGVCTIESASALEDSWVAARNIFTTSSVATVKLEPQGAAGFYRALAVDLSEGRVGFTNLVQSYNLLSTIAGAGGSPEAINKWRPEFEGDWATNVLLSRPHIAAADDAGNIYIADKDAHGVRKVTPEGRIFTVAGVNSPGDGPDEATPGTEVALNEPNGLWVRGDGTVYILDLTNWKVRRLDPDGTLTTLFRDDSGVVAGRGLWVSADESLVYFCSGYAVKRWTPEEGVTIYATGFAELGNLAVDPWGYVVVTDRSSHRVWRLFEDGTRTVIAGNGDPLLIQPGGGDGGLATLTALREVRGIWFLPTGAYFLCTHRGSQVWYVDVDGYLHLFLNGSTADTHAGDGTWFWNPQEYRVSECRAVTVDPAGNLLITDHDSGYIRKVEFLRHGP